MKERSKILRFISVHIHVIISSKYSGYATTKDATANECYNEQFLSIKSGCYNEHSCYTNAEEYHRPT